MNDLQVLSKLPEIYLPANLLSIYYVVDTVVDVSTCVI